MPSRKATVTLNFIPSLYNSIPEIEMHLVARCPQKALLRKQENSQREVSRIYLSFGATLNSYDSFILVLKPSVP
jgi:hypothetical protein